MPMTYQPHGIPELWMRMRNRKRRQATRVREHIAEMLMVSAQRARALRLLEPNVCASLVPHCYFVLFNAKNKNPHSFLFKQMLKKT